MRQDSQVLPNDRRRRQRGFTLIELLVSLAIMALVMGLLGAGIQTVSQGWDRSAGRLDTIDMLQRAGALLRRDIEGLRRLVWRDAAPPRFVFAGTPSGLQFVALEPAYPTRPGLYYVGYTVQRDSRGAVLMRARAPYNSKIAALEHVSFADAVPLIEGPYRLGFSYGDVAEGRLRWSPSWQSETRLPDLIRLDITNIANGAAPLPPLLLRPRADAEQACVSQRAQPCTIETDGDLEPAPSSKPAAGGSAK